MSTDPSLTDTDSSLEMASAAAAAAATATGPLGCCYSNQPPGLLQMTIIYTSSWSWSWSWAGPRPLVTSKTTSPTLAPGPAPCICPPSHILSVLVFSSVAFSQPAV